MLEEDEDAGDAGGGWGCLRRLGMLEAAGDALRVQLMHAAEARAQDAACTPWFVSPWVGR